MVLMKGLAQHGRHPIVREAFDGRDVALVAGDRECQARAHRLTVEQDRARAADAVFTAEMRPSIWRSRRKSASESRGGTSSTTALPFTRKRIRVMSALPDRARRHRSMQARLKIIEVQPLQILDDGLLAVAVVAGEEE